MIVDNAIQGTDEWLKARLGIPTSSNFDKIITTDGKPSKQRTKYMYQLAGERITQTSEATYTNANMQRGQELEDQARAYYELTTGNTVDTVGLCYPDKNKLYGASPDGLVEKDGLIEIKCPTSPVHIGYLLSGELTKDYFQQVQGQLLVTGRKWCDFYSFYPNIKPFCIRVTPDKKFINALKVELELFCKELDDLTEKIRG